MNNENKVTVKIIKSGNRYNAFDVDDKKWTSEIATSTRKNAFEAGNALERYIGSTGRVNWRQVPLSNMDIPIVSNISIPVSTDQATDMDYIHTSYKLKPKTLIMKELKWKYLVRSIYRGKNVLMTGPAGCAKTMAAKSAANALNRVEFDFNLGATQDPRATLIGNTHYDTKKGTFFSESLFVKAIQTPNAVILLDELSRAEPGAWNILMPVLDQGQRYLRLDEEDGQRTIKVAEGVTFISTANIGNEYTSTRVMDKALMDRFITVEMDLLNDVEEFGLLKLMFPTVNDISLKAIAEIAHKTRMDAASGDHIEHGISTRTSVEMAGLIFDGFKLEEAAEVCIYPQYSIDGGGDSERTFIKQVIQKYIVDETNEVSIDPNSDELFNDSEVNAATKPTA